jgi:PAS domain S-box-containing protein
MKAFNSLLKNIYGHISDVVYVYKATGKFLYHNESSGSSDQLQQQLNQPILEIISTNELDQPTSFNIRHKECDLNVSISWVTIENHHLLVAIIPIQELNNAQDLTDEIKHILLKTSVSDPSFYNQIGDLVANYLHLTNLQITIPNQHQKILINQYLHEDFDLMRSKRNQNKYINFVEQLIATSDINPRIPQEEFEAYFNNELDPLPNYLYFVPIKSQNNIIGGIGVFEHSAVEHTSSHLKNLRTIADYIGIFWGFEYLEEELLQQTSRLNAIFESSSDLIWSVDRTMEVVSFNQNYFRAIFYKYQGGIVTEHFKEDISQTSPFDDFWEAKYQEVFTGRSLHFEIELKHPNNAPVWKEIFLMPIFKANGMIEEVSGIARDISERKKTVEALHQEEEKFKQIFDSFQDLYVRVTLGGTINMISPSVKAMLGYSAGEVIGQNFTDFYLYNIKTRPLFRKVLRVETLRNIEIQLVGKSGQIIPCICNIRVIKNRKGTPIAIEGICRDITEIQETNEALSAAKDRLEISLKAEEQFLANMTHEIRTPMNGIIGLLDMMLNTKLTNKQTKYLSTIKQSSKLLLNLLNDILDLSKINAGKLQIRNSSLSIRNLLENIEILFSSEVNRKQLNFNIVIDEDVPEYIQSDKLRLLQIFSNLISNAIKFTPEGGSVSVIVNYLKTTTIKVSVIDTGIGIDAKNVKKLFKYFTQINQSYSDKFVGAGLGLAISRNLVKLLGGKIDVNSIYGQGSTFWFTFKMKVESKPSLQELTAANNLTKKHHYKLPKQSILVVDDNATNRMVAQEILVTSGMSVDSADNGQVAIDMVLKNKYDIVFMDIQMPQMDGIQAMTTIKEHDPKQVIVAMTAYDDQNQSAKFLELGFDEYLPKPITPDTILRTINDITINDQSVLSIDSLYYDFNRILDLAKYVDMDTLISTYQEFEKSIEGKVKGCQAAFTNHSYAKISDCAHSIKGDAATIGLTQIAANAEKIEKNINKEYFTSLGEDLNSLYLMLGESPKLIKEIINRLSHEHKNINS